MEDRNKKTIFNMPGDELGETLKRLSRYIMAVELAAMAACVPLIVTEKYLILTTITILMFLGVLAMFFCEERKTKFWKSVRTAQICVGAVGVLLIALSFAVNVRNIINVASYVFVGFMCLHSAVCFTEIRKNEEITVLRFVGAYTVVVTVIVFFIVKKWLSAHGIMLG